MSDSDRADFERQISDLNRAIIRAFTIDGEVRAPSSVTAALGRAFERFDDHDFAGAKSWCHIAEGRIVQEAAGLRAEAST